MRGGLAGACASERLEVERRRGGRQPSPRPLRVQDDRAEQRGGEEGGEDAEEERAAAGGTAGLLAAERLLIVNLKGDRRVVDMPRESACSTSSSWPASAASMSPDA